MLFLVLCWFSWLRSRPAFRRRAGRETDRLLVRVNDFRIDDLAFGLTGLFRGFLRGRRAPSCRSSGGSGVHSGSPRSLLGCSHELAHRFLEILHRSPDLLDIVGLESLADRLDPGLQGALEFSGSLVPYLLELFST